MRQFVLDASVALAWVLDNPIPASAVRAQQALLSGDRATVPVLWHLEIANGMAMAERRGILVAADVVTGIRRFEELCAQSIDTEEKIISIRQAWTTARLYKLSAYDSVYLELARQTQMPLATLDVALRAAAAKAGVPLLR